MGKKHALQSFLRMWKNKFFFVVFFLRYLRHWILYFSYFHGGYLIRNRKCLLFVSTWVHLSFYAGVQCELFIFLVFCVVFFFVFLWVLFVFGLFLVLNAANLSGLSIRDCPYQISPSGYIASVWLSILDCSSGYPASVSDCPYQISPSGYIVSVSGLSILDCPFRLYCQCLWIVHTWLSLQVILPVSLIVHTRFPLRVILPVSLDCPYLIVPSGYVASVSGLSILDCPFRLYCQCLIVHTWLPFGLYC